MILFRYILKNQIAPFLFSFFTLTAVFVLQFLMKVADQLVGKGLSAWIIIKLITFNLAWMVVLIVPMSVLVATLMAFGSMAQNNEIAIMKASGISLYKMIIPPILGGILVTLFLIYFNNNIYPDANHAARILREDISKTKPTVALFPGVFSQQIQGYSILSRVVNGDNLENVTIYDNTQMTTIRVITAKKGRLSLSKDQSKIILDLLNGEIHESGRIEKEIYRVLTFTQNKISIDATEFAFRQSGMGGERGDRELGAPAMVRIVDSLKNINAKNFSEFVTNVNFYFFAYTPYYANMKYRADVVPAPLYDRVKEKINSAKSSVDSRIASFSAMDDKIDEYWVEIHKKYSIPVACLIFVLIGAPLGTMTRRGGFGVAAGISLVFFLIYWTCLIGGEKLADRGLLSSFLGMWLANFLLGAFGIYILIKCAKEKVELNFDKLKKLVPKQIRALMVQNETENN